MATFTQVNPVATTTNIEQVGRDITFFTVNYGYAVNGSAGPQGAQAAVLKQIMMLHTIIAIGPLIGTNAQQTFAIEGPLYTPQNGSTLQAMIQALGTVDTIDLSGATVTVTKLGILTAAAVS